MKHACRRAPGVIWLKEGVRFVLLEFVDLVPAGVRDGTSLSEMAENLKSYGLRYVAAYTDYVNHENELYVCANALFALQECEVLRSRAGESRRSLRAAPAFHAWL